MKIIPPAEFITSVWKNGGGITHEILRHDHDGRLHWRLSIAEVASSGAFSFFNGCRRCLTVIEGAGMDLVSPQSVYAADFLKPVWFPGSEQIECRLRDGPCRDFNLIFDTAEITATLDVLDGNATMAPDSSWRGAYVVEGLISQGSDVASQGSFAILDQDAAVISGTVLLVTIMAMVKSGYADA